MLVINEKIINTNRKLTSAVKSILGKEYNVYRDFFLFVKGGNLAQAKKELEAYGIEVQADAYGDEIYQLIVLTSFGSDFIY